MKPEHEALVRWLREGNRTIKDDRAADAIVSLSARVAELEAERDHAARANELLRDELATQQHRADDFAHGYAELRAQLAEAQRQEPFDRIAIEGDGTRRLIGNAERIVAAEVVPVYRAPVPAQPSAPVAQPAPAVADDVARDAARYQWLRGRMVGAHFNFDDNGQCVLCFELPKDARVSADCDKTIDAAMLAAHAATQEKPE